MVKYFGDPCATRPQLQRRCSDEMDQHESTTSRICLLPSIHLVCPRMRVASRRPYGHAVSCGKQTQNLPGRPDNLSLDICRLISSLAGKAQSFYKAGSELSHAEGDNLFRRRNPSASSSVLGVKSGHWPQMSILTDWRRLIRRCASSSRLETIALIVASSRTIRASWAERWIVSRLSNLRNTLVLRCSVYDRTILC